jgi:Tfp pilus assembly protein FimT
MKTGTTLVELLLVLCLLGVVGSIAILSLRHESVHPKNTLLIASRQLDSLRSVALREGHERTVVIEDTSGAHTVTVLPDGSVLADSLLERALGFDRLTGRARAHDSLSY